MPRIVRVQIQMPADRTDAEIAETVINELNRNERMKEKIVTSRFVETVEDTMVRNGRSGGSLVVGKR